MAKKKVRKPRSASPRTYARTGQEKKIPSGEPAKAVSSPAPVTSDAKSSRSRAVDLASEYWYVGKDLRRTFALAGAMLVVLIALNFVIQ